MLTHTSDGRRTVYVQDAGNYYSVADLQHSIEMLALAAQWKKAQSPYTAQEQGITKDKKK